MSTKKKILLSVILVVIGSTCVRLINEVFGHGGWIANAIMATLVVLIWSKNTGSSNEDQSDTSIGNESSKRHPENPQPTVGKNGFTELMWFSGQGDVQICKKLLEIGNNDINQMDNKGATALVYAVLNGQKEVVSLLLDCGASKEIGSLKRLTPLEIAKRNGRQDLIALLNASSDSHKSGSGMSSELEHTVSPTTSKLSRDATLMLILFGGGAITVSVGYLLESVIGMSSKAVSVWVLFSGGTVAVLAYRCLFSK